MAETQSAPSLRELSEAATTDSPLFVHDFADPAVSSNPSPGDVTLSCDHPATLTVAFMGNGLTGTLEEARANAAKLARLWNDHRAGRLIDPATLTEAVAAARTEGVAAERERTAPIFAVLEEAAIWHDAQAKALSKQPPGGDRDWRRMEHAEQAEMLRAIPLEVALTPGGRTDG